MALTIEEKEFILRVHEKKTYKKDKTKIKELYKEIVDDEVTDEQASQKGSQLMARPEAKRYLAYIDKQADNALQVCYTMQKEDALRILTQIAIGVKYSETEVQDPDGNIIKKEVTNTNKDVISALTLMMKLQGWEAPQETHITGTNVIFSDTDKLED